MTTASFLLFLAILITFAVVAPFAFVILVFALAKRKTIRINNDRFVR